MMSSKEKCCGRSMGIVYSILYSDIEHGRDPRGRREILEGLYGPMFRSIRAIWRLSPGRGTADLLDVPMRTFLQWMKDRDRCPGSKLDPEEDNFDLISLFEGIQIDIGNFREKGHANDCGESEDEILLPVYVGDEFQRFYRVGDDLRCPVPNGHPMGLVDHSQLLPDRFTEEALSKISPKTLRLGTAWVRDESLYRMLNLYLIACVSVFPNQSKDSSHLSMSLILFGW